MRLIRTRLCVAGAASILLTAMSGCYEEIASQDEQQPPPQPTAQEGPVQSVGNPRQSSLAGAKRSAHNTVDRLEQRQRQIEKQLEEDQQGL